jgi:LytTr DNA-binding domain
MDLSVPVMNFLRRHIQTSEDSGVETERDRIDPGRDEAQTAGTSGGNRVMNGASWRIYAIIAVMALAFALVNAFSAAHDTVRRGGSYDLSLPLLWELTSAVVIVALLPLIDFGVRYVGRQPNWPLRAAWATGTILAFSVLHIAGMVALRKLALATVGRSYSFGLFFSEFVYEFRKDVVTCCMIGAVLWLGIRRREAVAEKAADSIRSAPKSPPVLWLRDGTARIRIEPREIVWISSAGNYVEYAMLGGRTHLVRGTLAAEEARLGRFSIVRVHRTRLVNLARVSGLKAGPNGDFELTLDTGQSISGSRRYRRAVASIEGPAAVPASVPNDNGTDP